MNQLNPLSLLPRWVNDRYPDPQHFHRRRFTPRYRAKQRIVRDIWTVAGGIMLINPIVPYVALVGLTTILLSFVILDETP
ncbi:MAG: hypothetical protein R3310_08350 [Candidatus Competibacteraceae bacterium]|nr:hypothetical protein [Candidatus Competibacteraceae bacterium]